MSKIRVLIVDDSVVFRSQIKSAFEQVDWVDVVGVASNGKIALEKIKLLKPDLVTLDLEMPELNGIETLKEVRSQSLPVKVIVFASTSVSGAQKTMEALHLGALDFVAKPNGEETKSIYELLIPRVSALMKPSENFFAVAKSVGHVSAFAWDKFSPQAILIGSSTGGPTALEKIFSQLKAPFRCPVFITQHMPPIFTASLAARLEKLCGVTCAEGKDGELVQPNRVYMAPGNFHMQIIKQQGTLKISLNQQEMENSVRPAVDQMFRSAAALFPGSALGVVLTGMGKDGLAGSHELKKYGSPILIQNRESCVVFGMPGAIHEAGIYDSMQNLEQITHTLQSYLSSSDGQWRKAL